MAIVNTNFNSVFGTVQINRIERAINLSTVRISSGKKLNYAGDSPSGVSAAGQFKKTLSGIGQATLNASKTETMLKYADAAMNEISEYLISMRDLALQAANDATLTPADFTNLDAEYQAYLTDAQSVAANTMYNGNNLLDGTYAGGKNAQVGPNANDTITVTIDNIDAVMTGGIAGTDVTSAVNATAALAQIDNALDSVLAAQGKVGTGENEMDVSLTALGFQEVNMTAALSNIVDADMAAEISTFARLQILSQSSAAVLAQANYVSERLMTVLDRL